MKRYERELTAKELAALPDEDIDYSDIPELDEQWFRTAKLVMPDQEAKERITIRVSREVTEYFRRQGTGYQSRMNAVLKAYVDTQKARGTQPH